MNAERHVVIADHDRRRAAQVADLLEHYYGVTTDPPAENWAELRQAVRRWEERQKQATHLVILADHLPGEEHETPLIRRVENLLGAWFSGKITHVLALVHDLRGGWLRGHWARQGHRVRCGDSEVTAAALCSAL